MSQMDTSHSVVDGHIASFVHILKDDSKPASVTPPKTRLIGSFTTLQLDANNPVQKLLGRSLTRKRAYVLTQTNAIAVGPTFSSVQEYTSSNTITTGDVMVFPKAGQPNAIIIETTEELWVAMNAGSYPCIVSVHEVNEVPI